MNHAVPYNQVSRLYMEILRKLDDLRRRQNLVWALHGLLFSVFLVITMCGCAVLIEAFASMTILGRTLVFWATLASSLGIVCWFFVRPLLHLLGLLGNSDDYSIAGNVGEHFPSIKDRLLNVLQVFRQKDSLLYSAELSDASFADVGEDIKGLDFAEAVDYSSLKKAGRNAASSLAVAALLFGLFPSAFIASADRLLHHRQAFTPRPLFAFIVQPGNIEVVKGDNIPIVIRIQGEPQKEISLFVKEDEQREYDKKELRSDSLGVFRYELQSIRYSTEYYVEAQDIRSDDYKITVVDRPMVRNLRMRLTYPSYTNIPARYQDDNVGDVTALAGTRLNLEVTMNKDVKDAKVVFSDSGQLPMTISDIRAAASFVLRKDRTYHILLTDENNVTNTNPIEYQLKAVPDEYPTIAIVEPGRDVNISEDMRLSMLLKIHDDFGFTKVQLGYRLSKSKYIKPSEDYTLINIPLPQYTTPDVDVPYFWNLTGLDLVPEDVVSYFVEVYDNDAISGPKVARSDIYTVRFPSLNEIFAQADQQQDKAIQDLGKSKEQAEELKKTVDEINRDLKKNLQQLDWQEQKKAEELVKKYQNLQKQLENVSQNLEQMVKEMQEHKAISPETMEKYMELQKLFNDINSPELQEVMRKLQEAMQNIRPDIMREAMKKFSFSEENFRKGIERTLNLLKRIQIEQKTDEILKRTEKMLEQQAELQKEAANTNADDKAKQSELAKKQEDLKKQLEEMKRELSELEKKMNEFPEEMPLSELQQATQDLADQNLEEKMGQVAQQCQGGQCNSPGAKKKMSEIQKALSEFQQKMQQAKKKLQEKQQQQVVQQLKKSLHEILELSKQQESLRDKSQEVNPNSPLLHEIAQEQMNVAGKLMNVTNDLMELSQKTFAVTPEMGKAIGQALAQMEQALNNLEERNGSLASQQQGQAMSSLNEAAMLVQNAMQSMMQAGGGGGMMQAFMQRLQQLAGQQQGINDLTLQFGQGELTMEQQAEMARLAAEQEVVRKSLEQLKEEMKSSGNKALGDLGQITKEMEEVVKDMKEHNIKPETVQRQERILSRLLDAQRSMRERDYEKKRQARPGEDVVRKSPSELDSKTQGSKDKLMEDLQKAMEEGYSKDYENLIRRYFEALQNMKIQQ